jgi:hypothetical protein
MNAGSSALARFGCEITTQRLHALLHAHEAEPARRASGDPASVVLDGEFNSPGLCIAGGRGPFSELYKDVLRLCMANRVGQTLLDAAVERQINGVAVAVLERSERNRKIDLRMFARAPSGADGAAGRD